ncbi:hypothetical protein [Methanothermobacter thermautotrophicus]|jgi:hypothetical protein|uniref:hypothetical protein n=1 Tax=Methanothermobacter thermautotrophicus TaxID=145262 RepID=UPI001867DB83|nr:hypothetical protein [Methanothermobacter thermautotrophicus]
MKKKTRIWCEISTIMTCARWIEERTQNENIKEWAARIWAAANHLEKETGVYE